MPRALSGGAGVFKRVKRAKRGNFTQQRIMLTALFMRLAEVLLGLAYTSRLPADCDIELSKRNWYAVYTVAVISRYLCNGRNVTGTKLGARAAPYVRRWSLYGDDCGDIPCLWRRLLSAIHRLGVGLVTRRFSAAVPIENLVRRCVSGVVRR